MENEPNKLETPQPEAIQIGEKSDEIHLRELQSNSSVIDWKREIYKLVKGGRKSEMRLLLGTASDYVEGLVFSSNDKIASRSHFIDALNEILTEISLASFSSYEASILLDLILNFVPSRGFVVIADYLRSGGTFDDNFYPIGNRKPDDLHETALATLSVYYRVAPQDAMNPAFRTYIGILRQHLHYPKYCGFAAKELVKLEMLQPGTAEMRSILRERPECLDILVPYLSSEERRYYAKNDLKNLASDCFKIESSEPFRRFFAVLEKLKAEVHYDDELPSENLYTEKNAPLSVDFIGGDNYEFGFSDEEIELFVKHRIGIDEENLTDAVQIISENNLTEEEKKEGLSIYFYQSVSLGGNTLRDFVQRLETIGARIIVAEDQNIYIERENKSVKLHYRAKGIEKYLIWQIKNSQPEKRLNELAEAQQKTFAAW